MLLVKTCEFCWHRNFFLSWMFSGRQCNKYEGMQIANVCGVCVSTMEAPANKQMHVKVKCRHVVTRLSCSWNDWPHVPQWDSDPACIPTVSTMTLRAAAGQAHSPPICSGSWHLQVYSVMTGFGLGICSSSTPAKLWRRQVQEEFLPCRWLTNGKGEILVITETNNSWINTKYTLRYLILIAAMCGSQGGQDCTTFFPTEEVSRWEMTCLGSHSEDILEVLQMFCCFVDLRAFMASSLILSFVQSFKDIS